MTEALLYVVQAILLLAPALFLSFIVFQNTFHFFDIHQQIFRNCSRSKFLSKNLKIIVKTFREIFSDAYSIK